MKRARLILIPILLATLLLGCVVGAKTFTQMSPKERATMFMGLYNRQYNDYKVQVAMPNLTDSQKKVLTARKALLMQVYPLIAQYDMAQASGQSTTSAQEQAIMALFNQLATVVSK